MCHVRRWSALLLGAFRGGGEATYGGVRNYGEGLGSPEHEILQQDRTEPGPPSKVDVRPEPGPLPRGVCVDLADP